MRVDPTTTDIHDLADAEARELRSLCERMMRGDAPVWESLFLQWADAVDPSFHDGCLDAAAKFLPRALFALLRRAEAERDALRDRDEQVFNDGMVP